MTEMKFVDPHDIYILWGTSSFIQRITFIFTEVIPLDLSFMKSGFYIEAIHFKIY